jgi:hypothetical protein
MRRVQDYKMKYNYITWSVSELFDKSNSSSAGLASFDVVSDCIAHKDAPIVAIPRSPSLLPEISRLRKEWITMRSFPITTPEELPRAPSQSCNFERRTGEAYAQSIKNLWDASIILIRI